MEAAYLLFKAGSFYFLAPLEQVVSVESLASARARALSVYDLVKTCHLSERPVETPYILVLNLDGEKVGAAVEQVVGVREICGADRYKLEAPVIGQDNQYLDSVAALEALDAPMAYLLDMHALFEKLAASSEAILE